MKSGESIIKYGDIGDTFYIIVKGAVDVYVPVETKVELTLLELTRLITDYKEMVLEINGVTGFSTPVVLPTQKEAFEAIKLDKVLHKLIESKAIEEKKQEIFEKGASALATKQKFDIAVKLSQRLVFLYLGLVMVPDMTRSTNFYITRDLSYTIFYFYRKAFILEEKLVNRTAGEDEYIIKYLKKVVRLQEGGSFGELALLLSKPRSATIKAV